MPISCRFYEQRYPKLDDVVVVTVRSIQEVGAYVQLLEYKNIEGMILMSELSRRRIRSVNKLIRVGRNEVVVVIRVDTEKGYIDLSKRRVSAEEVLKCEERFARAKTVNSILRHTIEMLAIERGAGAEATDAELEALYQRTAWAMDRKAGRPGAAYDTLKAALQNPAVLDDCELEPRTRELLLENVRRLLTPHPVKIRADMEVSCLTYEGVESIRAALRAGAALTTESMPLHVALIAPPTYVLSTTTLDRSGGLARLNDVLAVIKSEIERRGGKFTVKMPPKVVNDREEEELKKQMQQLELQNAEVAGDEDLSDSSDEGDEARDPSVKPERPEQKIDEDDDDDEDAASTDGKSDAAATSATPATAGEPDGSRAPSQKAKTSSKS